MEDLFAESQYQNDYDQPLDVRCASGAGMYQVQSIYDGGRRDRRWSWYCKNLKRNANTQCAFTDYVNHFDEPMYFMCGSNQYIAGVYSYHDNGREDRRWRFTCCSTEGLKKFIAAGWQAMPMTFTRTWIFKQVLMRSSLVLMATIGMIGSMCIYRCLWYQYTSYSDCCCCNCA